MYEKTNKTSIMCYNVLCLDCDEHYFDFDYKCWLCSRRKCIYDDKENKINRKYLDE